VTARLPAAKRPPFFQLCLAEPFRIFFPLGVLFGLSGVSLWPLYFLGIHTSFYPAIMHGSLMVEGFLTAFVFGFLATAMPRMTDTPPLARWELGALLALHVTAVGLHIALRDFAGNCVYLALLALFTVCMGRRFARRLDLPPPGFVLVVLGFLNALAGASFLLLLPWFPTSGVFMSGELLLVKGWLLLLILGIGGFLLPRFLEMPQREYPESRAPSAGWKSQAILAAVTGIFLTATLLAEGQYFHPRLVVILQCLAAGGYLLATVPFGRTKVPNVTLTLCLRAALVLLGAGLAFPLCWPLQRLAGQHVIFIGGFTLLIFTVATRVVLGHSGGSHLFPAPLPFLRGAAVLFVAAAVLRAVADFLLLTRPHWINAAAYAWMLAALVWSWRILPRVRIADAEE
jgi:uncharacterized protein involved in response to NO